MTLRALSIFALALIAFAAPAQAQTKPPIRGLVSMGAYKFVAFPGTQPVNTMAPLNAKAQAQGSGDFSSMWAGQAAGLGRALPARELTRKLADEAQALMQRMAG